MKSYLSVVGFLVIALLSVAGCKREVASPKKVPTAPPEIVLPESYRELPPEEIAALLKAKPGIFILDVRTETEWAEEGHLEGAHLVNYFRENLRGYLDTLDRSKPYLVHCAIGGRATLTAAHMAELGFTEVYLLKGGLNAWKKARMPLVRG